MDDYEKFRNISCQPYSVDMLEMLMAATNIVHKRFENCPSTLLSANLTHFPSPEEVSRRTAVTPVQQLLPPVDGSWIEIADKISRLPDPPEETNVTTAMWNLVRGGPLELPIVDEYLDLLRATSLHTAIAKVRPLSQDENMIGTEGLDRPTIIPFLCGHDWAFAVAYHDCIHWYDSSPSRQTPSFSAIEARRVVEGWKGPQHSNPNDVGIFMLMGIRLVLQRKPHLSQRAADQIARTFRARMLGELLAGKVEPDGQRLCREGVMQAAETDEGSMFVAQPQYEYSPGAAPEADLFTEALYMQEQANGANRSSRSMSSVDEVISASLRRQANSPRPALRQMSSIVEDNEVPMDEDAVLDDLVTVHGSISPPGPQEEMVEPEPDAHPSSATTANTSRRRKGRAQQNDMWAQGDTADGTRKTLKLDVNSLVSRKVILENLAAALQCTRLAVATEAYDKCVLWFLGQDNAMQGKLQQRYSRVLFVEKMEEQARQDVTMSGINDKQWKNMKRDSRNWRIWKDVRDAGREHDDLGPFVTLCAFPGSMDSKYLSKKNRDSLVADLKRELRSDREDESGGQRRSHSSSPLRHWLRDARPLCDAILSGALPTSPLNIENHDLTFADEVTDEDWILYTSIDLATGPW
ncbi:unnamed protein product [Fusarium graminearum]|nr:unnamed protein product [Fusarium graminearum]